MKLVTYTGNIEPVLVDTLDQTKFIIPHGSHLHIEDVSEAEIISYAGKEPRWIVMNGEIALLKHQDTKIMLRKL